MKEEVPSSVWAVLPCLEDSSSLALSYTRLSTLLLSGSATSDPLYILYVQSHFFDSKQAKLEQGKPQNQMLIACPINAQTKPHCHGKQWYTSTN